MPDWLVNLYWLVGEKESNRPMQKTKPVIFSIGHSLVPFATFLSCILRSQAICFEPKKSWKILADLPAEGRSPEAENSYHPI